VMTPMCHTAVRPFPLVSSPKHAEQIAQDDARRIVGYSKYPPNGSRGYGPSFCPHAFDVPDAVYPAQADDNLLVVVQIESPQAVRNVQAIAEVPGVDIIFIGTQGAKSALRGD
jgi:2-keto-3-deoxy-L-rhamnonate aldolase RhmA